jgi:hypothetical protein
MSWEEILKDQVKRKGQAAVARELGYTASTVSQIINGKYPADTARVGERVMAIYGNRGLVNCPQLGEITPLACLDNHRLAGDHPRTGDPDTMRLYRACRNCEVRK